MAGWGSTGENCREGAVRTAGACGNGTGNHQKLSRPPLEIVTSV